MTELKHWRIEREPGGLAWLIFDKAGESTNTLSAEACANWRRRWTSSSASRRRAW
jgi:hypothetical protein